MLALVGLVLFATYRSSDESDAIGQVEIWGVYDKRDFDRYLNFAEDRHDGLSRVSYRQFNEANFNQEVLEALARGEAPDLLLIRDDLLYSYLDKVYTITPSTYSRSMFTDNFVDGAEILFQNDGIVGLPLVADPLMMYWNRDLFATAGVAQPPTSWTEFFELAQDLAVVDESLSVQRAAIAFGETINVDYFRSIIATLIFQVGNPIIAQDSDGDYQAELDGGRNTESAYAALRFYTEFSDASKAVYTWNRSMPDSENAFLAGRLAVHFAPLSAVRSIRERNPNLNFALAEIPTVDTSISKTKAVHADFYSFVIPRSSDNVGGAFQAAVLLTGEAPMRYFAEQGNFAPVRRSLVSEPSQESYQDIAKREALYARTFLDPNPDNTTQVLANMVEYITSGQRSIDSSIYVSNAALDDSIR